MALNWKAYLTQARVCCVLRAHCQRMVFAVNKAGVAEQAGQSSKPGHLCVRLWREYPAGTKGPGEGLEINTIIHKVIWNRWKYKTSQEKYLDQSKVLCSLSQTDRPSSQFWNSKMVRGHRRLALKYQVNIRHFSEQSSHNKVSVAIGIFAALYQYQFDGIICTNLYININNNNNTKNKQCRTLQTGNLLL